MTTLSLDGIDPAFLTIDGRPAVARPQPPGVVYFVAPPSVFDVAPGWHALRYDLAGASERAAERAAERGADAVNHTGEPPIEVRVTVPAEGLTLRRIDRFFVDPRGIATPTGETGLSAITPAPSHAPMSLWHTAFMVAGGLALGVLAWQAFTGDE